MKKKLFSILKYLLFLGIGIFLTWWQLSKMTALEWAQFKESFLNARYIYFVPVFFITLLGHFSRAVRWKLLIEPMGYRTSNSNAFYAVMCGYLGNTFLPRAGEILRCTLLGRYEKIPVTKLFGTILVERVFDLFCYFIVMVITFLIQIETVSDFIKLKISQISHVNVSSALWIIITVALAAGLLLFLLARKLILGNSNHPFVLKLKGLHLGLKEGVTTIIHLKKRKLFLAHTIFIWFTYLFEVYIGFSAIAATSHLGIGAAFSVLSLVTLAMIVSPGGLGAFPVAVQQVLLIYNVDNISFGWLMWGATTCIIIVVGIICFGLFRYRFDINEMKAEKIKA